jgi:RNA polymerase sigma-70 factor (ECF subfamily)
MTSALALETSQQLSDTEVVRRILGGDTALFEILMRRYNQRVYRAVRAVLGSDDDCEDTMQQAYLNAFTHLRQFEERAQFSTWLIRIAVNEAIARRRKQQRHPWDGDEELMMAIESEAPDPEQQALASQMREVMERELAALPSAYRSVLVLREVEGLSTAETAECLNVSEDVVKTRLHRARGMVRAALERRAGETMGGIYRFGNERCDRVVANVMEKVSFRAATTARNPLHRD